MIIGIAGKSRSGKTTVSKMLNQILGFPIVGVSDPLKNKCSQLFDIPLDDFYSAKKDDLISINLTKKQIEVFLSSVGLENVPIRIRTRTRTEFTSLRDLLQYLGTDIVRKHDPLYWLKTLGKKPNVIIADVRFVEEVEWIKSQQGILYYVDRDDVPKDNHPSENQITMLDDFIIIPNNGSLDDLQHFVLKISNL